MNRREFLKFAGMSSLLGVGGFSLANTVRNDLEASQTKTNPTALTAKRWAMVVDMSKFKTPEDYQKCIDACHRVHNVPPKTDNPKHEIKWMWTETYEHAFPGNEDKYLAEKVKDMPFLLLCGRDLSLNG